MSAISLKGKGAMRGRGGGDMICITVHYTAQEKTFPYTLIWEKLPNWWAVFRTFTNVITGVERLSFH